MYVSQKKKCVCVGYSQWLSYFQMDHWPTYIQICVHLEQVISGDTDDKENVGC
jgi:hypothetical protein